MLVHALNAFLAWRHLLTHGYLAEARLFTRSIHESLSRALVFKIDKAFAKRFYAGNSIRPKEIRDTLSKALGDDKTPEKEVYQQFRELYDRLSIGAHPTLNSFSLRTAAVEPGDASLAKVVPEGVLMGGFLEDDVGRIAWLGLARNVAAGLASVHQVLKEGTGGWDREYQAYRSKVERLIEEHDATLEA